MCESDESKELCLLYLLRILYAHRNFQSLSAGQVVETEHPCAYIQQGLVYYILLPYVWCNNWTPGGDG